MRWRKEQKERGREGKEKKNRKEKTKKINDVYKTEVYKNMEVNSKFCNTKF